MRYAQNQKTPLKKEETSAPEKDKRRLRRETTRKKPACSSREEICKMKPYEKKERRTPKVKEGDLHIPCVGVRKRVCVLSNSQNRETTKQSWKLKRREGEEKGKKVTSLGGGEGECKRSSSV